MYHYDRHQHYKLTAALNNNFTQQLLILPTYSAPTWVCHFCVYDVYQSFSEILTSRYHILVRHDQAKPCNENDELHEIQFFHLRPI